MPEAKFDLLNEHLMKDLFPMKIEIIGANGYQLAIWARVKGHYLSNYSGWLASCLGLTLGLPNIRVGRNQVPGRLNSHQESIVSRVLDEFEFASDPKHLDSQSNKYLYRNIVVANVDELQRFISFVQGIGWPDKSLEQAKAVDPPVPL